MIDRYNRQLILKEVGDSGQQLLKEARVLVVGVGGLGSPLATYLATAGVGTLGLVDPDMVSLENLHRQPLYGTEDIGDPKAFVAARKLKLLNPEVEVEIHSHALDRENAAGLIQEYDLVCDGTDNFIARYAINDACVALKKTNVHATVFQFQGQLSVFAPGGPCYRCLFPKPPSEGIAPSCAEAGVLGSLQGVMGSLQATEALKIILKAGEALIGRILLYDGLSGTFETVAAERDHACPCCGDNPNAALMEDPSLHCAPAHSTMPGSVPEISPSELFQELHGPNPPDILDVREPEELELSRLPHAANIPVGELMERASELNPDRKLVVMCRTGTRSANATAYLIHLGFKDVRNLATGINGWAKTVDPTLIVY